MKKALVIIAILVLLVVIIFVNKRPNLTNEPIFYLTGVKYSVSKEIVPFDLTADRLKDFANECDTKYEEGYFEKLVAKFSNVTKTVYHFKYIGESQDSSDYTVTLLPNKAGYTAYSQFKKDFSVCAAGYSEYPKTFNQQWLVFDKSCSTGFDDGSGRPHGCEIVRNIISPSLKLK